MKRYALFAVFSGCLLAVHDRVRIRFGILVPQGVLFRLWDAPVYSRKTIFHEEEFSTMTKRLFALLLCLMMCASCFVGCTVEEKKEVVLTPEEEELLKGATINMHLSEMIYDFDPANAYNNEAALKIISLLYEPLFYLDEKGKVKSRLIDRYEISENEEEGEYKMTLHIAERAKWSDTNPISANDVVFSWKRVLEADASYPAAALLFDVRNAREANQGNTSIDNVGLSAPSEKVVEIFFEGKIDYDQFILNLTSYALAPLRENLATKTSYYEEVVDKDKEIIIIHRKYDDWAKKPATMAYSGPFRIRTIKYPDDPVKDKDGNIRLSAEGEYMYYRYAIDASDSMGMMLIRLEENNWYLDRGDGKIIGCNNAYLLSLGSSESEADRALYEEFINNGVQIQGLDSDFAREPQNEPQIVLERNSQYFKNEKDDSIYNKEVTPYRLVVDYSMSDAEIMDAFNKGEIFYVGDIPLSGRGDYKDKAIVTNALSTHAYYLNQNSFVYYNHVELDQSKNPILYDAKNKQLLLNANGIPSGYTTELKAATLEMEEKTEGSALYKRYVYYNSEKQPIYSAWTLISDETGIKNSTIDTTPVLGEKLLQNVSIRNALSLAIDREAIASAVVFAQAADALVPTGVFDSNSAKKTFRENAANAILKTTADPAAAKALLPADLDPSQFTIMVSYASYDTVHTMIAEMVKASWEALGFNVKLDPLAVIDNTDFWTTTGELLTDVKDDLRLEALLSGNYNVMAVDMVAFSADAFSVLAPFAKLFSGMGMDMKNFDQYGVQHFDPATHPTGFDDATYNEKIEAIFAEKDISKRTALMHEAEAYLLSQMPVIPIVYNQNAILSNDEMLTDRTGNYYVPAGFVNCYLKGTDQYNEHIAFIRNVIIIVVASVVVLALVIFLVVTFRIKKKKREEEIARISAEHEAKLREIRPGASRKVEKFEEPTAEKKADEKPADQE